MILWWIGLALVLILAGLGVTLALLMRGKAVEQGTLGIDGRPVPTFLHFGSKLPKVLGKACTTIGTTICCRTYPTSYPQRVVGHPPVEEILIAHECYHVVDRERRGFFRYWCRALWQILTIRSHDARPFEAEAVAAAPLIAAGAFPGVSAADIVNRF